MKPNEMNKRLGTLESYRTTVTEDAEKIIVQAAYGRIFESLWKALPESIPVDIPPNTREHYEKSVFFKDLITELDERITAGTLTEADNTVLASISDADQRAAGTTAVRAVQSIARLWRSVSFPRNLVPQR